MSDLTDKQQIWLNEYLQCWNATEAARKAGYSKPRQSGYENLSKPYIRAEIAARLADKKMSADEALARLSDMARSDMTDFIHVYKGTGVVSLDMQRAQTAGKLFLVKKYKETKYGAEIELHDPMRALELIARHHGVLKDGAVLVLPPKAVALLAELDISTSLAVQEFIEILEQIAAEANADGNA